MFVIPFFGDQYVSAKYIEKYKIGMSSVGDKSINDFFNNTIDLDLTEYNLSKLLDTIMKNLDIYTKNINEIVLTDNTDKIINLVTDNFKFLDMMNFNRGGLHADLLFGTTKDRINFVELNLCSSKFMIAKKDDNNEYILFNKLGLTKPVLLDQWNDLLFYYLKHGKIDVEPHIMNTLIDYYKYSSKYINFKNKDDQLLLLCCVGIDFFIKNNYTIHFVIDTCDKKQNPATSLEITYIEDKLLLEPDIIKKIIVYKNNKICKFCPNVNDIIERHREEFDRLDIVITNFLFTIKDKYNVWYQKRLKSVKSLKHKIEQKKVIKDIIGFRIIYPWTKDLDYISNMMIKYSPLDIFDIVYKERSKVIYLYGKHKYGEYEIQLWPTIIYHCFEFEHDKIYKPKDRLISYSLEKSDQIREHEHVLQDIIDKNRILDIVDIIT